jgi:hypothetical protein
VALTQAYIMTSAPGQIPIAAFVCVVQLVTGLQFDEITANLPNAPGLLVPIQTLPVPAFNVITLAIH